MNTPVHSSRTGGPHRNTGGSIVSVLEGTRSKLQRAARLALHNPTRRALLKVIATSSTGVTYRDLFDALPVSERWVREIVADLRREGIVETPGNPALIQFTSRDVMLAVKEVVVFLASEWIDAILPSNENNNNNSPTTRYSKTYLQTMATIIRGRGG